MNAELVFDAVREIGRLNQEIGSAKEYIRIYRVFPENAEQVSDCEEYIVDCIGEICKIEGELRKLLGVVNEV